MMSKQTVALIGRPNVGKSTLFNKLIGRRISVVSDESHVTRDCVSAECFWRDKSFLLMDTGGFDQKENDNIINNTLKQTKEAVLAANFVVFVVDITVGLTLKDEEVAKFLRRSGKPVVVCANKCDSTGPVRPEFYEFYSLGFKEVVPVSSVHGHGSGDLLDVILKFCDFSSDTTEKEELINVAVIGKPNAGKSSLVNKIFGQERCMVSGVSGTTRDIVDVKVENDYGNFCFVDTAGMRKKSKISNNIDKFSVLRAKMAADRSDICATVVDVTEGLTEQDLKIAGYANASGKAVVIVANKCDVKIKGKNFIEKFETDFAQRVGFLSWALVVFVSAKTGKGLEHLFAALNRAFKSRSIRITTGRLNAFLLEATSRVSLPTDKGKSLKIFYIAQVSVKPPKFIFFVNSKDLFHFSYKRYLENKLREVFDLAGTPVEFVVRERKKLNGGSRLVFRSKNST